MKSQEIDPSISQKVGHLLRQYMRVPPWMIYVKPERGNYITLHQNTKIQKN